MRQPKQWPSCLTVEQKLELISKALLLCDIVTEQPICLALSPRNTQFPQLHSSVCKDMGLTLAMGREITSDVGWVSPVLLLDIAANSCQLGCVAGYASS